MRIVLPGAVQAGRNPGCGIPVSQGTMLGICDSCPSRIDGQHRVSCRFVSLFLPIWSGPEQGFIRETPLDLRQMIIHNGRHHQPPLLIQSNEPKRQRAYFRVFFSDSELGIIVCSHIGGPFAETVESTGLGPYLPWRPACE